MEILGLKVDHQLIIEVSQPQVTLNTVQSGDSLSKIAKAHNGDAMKHPVIFKGLIGQWARPWLRRPPFLHF